MGINAIKKLATPSQRKKLKKRIKIIDYLNTDGPYKEDKEDEDEYKDIMNIDEYKKLID